jgi:hypothetical protein
VVVHTQSLSRPDAPRVAAAAAVAVALFVGSWWGLHHGFYKHRQIIDTPVYQYYGDAIWNGNLPYRDFAVEYPPGALPMFAVPGLAKTGENQDVTTGFRRTFETLMWLSGVAALLAMAVGLRALRASRRHVWLALGFAALAPLALGSVVLSRFDLWPAALVVAALAALLSGRFRLGSGLLGVAISVKLYPAVLVPVAVAYAWRREGRREALACLGVAAAAVAVVFAPFVALAPRGVWHSVTVQLTRPLQIESLGSALLLAAHHAWGYGVTMESSHGSQNLAGHRAHLVAVVSTVLQVAALVAVWTVFARGPATRERFVRASAAALVAFVGFGKVFSPQFLIWLIPVVPLVRGRRGLVASGLLGVALVLTQIWFPVRYWRLPLRFDPTISWLVLARDVTLIALLAVLVLRDRPRSQSPGHATEIRTESQLVARPS